MSIYLDPASGWTMVVAGATLVSMSTVPADIDQNPPDWVRMVVAGNQALEDNHTYANKVSNYLKQVSDWVAANTINRANHLPITAVPVKPQREIFYAVTGPGDGEGVRNGWKSYLADVDPFLPNAVLPPPIPVTGSSPILGPGSSNTGGTDPTLAAVYALLQKIAFRVGVS